MLSEVALSDAHFVSGNAGSVASIGIAAWHVSSHPLFLAWKAGWKRYLQTPREERARILRELRGQAKQAPDPRDGPTKACSTAADSVTHHSAALYNGQRSVLFVVLRL